MELYAAASLFQREMYVFAPTLEKMGRTHGSRFLPSYSPHEELVFPTRDESWPGQLEHMELCHTFGNQYDVVRCTDGFYLLLKPTL